MSHIYERLATVLEKTADFLDAQEAEKIAAAQNERRKLVAEFSEKYASVTGEELPEEALAKLASSDEKLLAAFQKLAGHVDGSRYDAPEDLGEPGDMPDDDPIYMTKKAALAANVDAASESFLTFIMSE